MIPDICCPFCGPIHKEDINVFNYKLRKQNFDLSPIYPTCKKCDSLVTINNKCRRGDIIVLNGTCGSGKSSVAIELMKNYGFIAIDMDCAMQSFRYKYNVNQVDYRSDEMLVEIANQIDLISLFSDKMVLALVMLKEDVNRYKKIFEERNLNYRLYLLRPSYEKAVERCQSRTCHASKTPEYWIKHFYDLLDFYDPINIIDNTELTITETVNAIRFQCRFLA